MTEMKCVVCFDDDVILKKHSVNCFKCYTCNDGFVCIQCIPDFDPYMSSTLGDLKSVRDTIKCPCCRQENWNYHYNQIILVSLGEIWENDMWETSDVIKIFIKNYAEAKGFDLAEYLGEN